MVSTRLYPTRVAVVAGDASSPSMTALSDKGKVRYDWQHYIPVVREARRTAQWRAVPGTARATAAAARSLLRESGGDRLMAKILALVPSAGLERCWWQWNSRWRRAAVRDA